MIQERERSSASGLAALPVLLLVGAGSGLGLWRAIQHSEPVLGLAAAAVGLLSVICLNGLFVINPNEAVILQFFGSYAGTIKVAGLRWTNPLYTRTRLSLRVRNFDSSRLKVNDLVGNPIEIAAVVVWQVVDTAQAAFQVEDFQNFVHVQSEAALRNLATRYAYDAHGEGDFSLRSHTEEIAEKLRGEIQSRLSQAGVGVLEARISHLAYAPEIAQAMLRRQQASAVVAARQKIVEGAVGMVEMALNRLSGQKIVVLDEERKAAMVSNLLVVLCGEREVQPVVNAGQQAG